MEAVVGLITVVCLVLAIVGLFKPAAVLPAAFKPTRIKAFAGYIALMFVAAFLIGGVAGYTKAQKETGDILERATKLNKELGEREAASGTPAAAERPKPDLELLEDKGIPANIGIKIRGRIRNNTSKQYHYVQVTFNLYDDAGDQIGTAFANITDLEPNGTWSFEAIALSERASEYKLAKITGY